LRRNALFYPCLSVELTPREASKTGFRSLGVAVSFFFCDFFRSWMVTPLPHLSDGDPPLYLYSPTPLIFSFGVPEDQVRSFPSSDDHPFPFFFGWFRTPSPFYECSAKQLGTLTPISASFFASSFSPSFNAYFFRSLPPRWVDRSDC